MPKLMIDTGGPEPTEIELKPGPNSFGSSPENDFQIDHPSVSPFHCEIQINADRAVIRDLDSGDGTFVDQEPIREAVLRPGQSLRVGEVEMVFESLRLPPPTPTQSIGETPFELAASTPAEPRICRNHPQTKAEFLCERCRKAFCKPCVKRRQVGKMLLSFCPACGDACLPLDAPADPAQRAAASLPTLAGQAFVYPFKRNGLALMIGGTLFLGILDFISRLPLLGLFALLIGGFASAYVCAYLQRIIQSSAQGEAEMPSWPEMTDFREDILGPALRFLGAFAFCLGPGLLWFRLAPDEFKHFGVLLLGLGGLYLPMGLLAIAMYDDLSGLNPVLVIVSMLRAPLAYFGICFLIAAVLAAGIAIDFFSDQVRIPILTSLAFAFAGLYLQVVTMRILGLFYYTQQERLDWG